MKIEWINIWKGLRTRLHIQNAYPYYIQNYTFHKTRKIKRLLKMTWFQSHGRFYKEGQAWELRRSPKNTCHTQASKFKKSNMVQNLFKSGYLSWGTFLMISLLSCFVLNLIKLSRLGQLPGKSKMTIWRLSAQYVRLPLGEAEQGHR